MVLSAFVDKNRTDVWPSFQNRNLTIKACIDVGVTEYGNKAGASTSVAGHSSTMQLRVPSN